MMDAVKYLKDRARLCKSAGACAGCSFWKTMKCRCEELEKRDPEKAVKFIEDWAKENPVKTRQSEFLKLYPDSEKDHGVINIEPCELNTNHQYSNDCMTLPCRECRRNYWLTEVEQ